MLIYIYSQPVCLIVAQGGDSSGNSTSWKPRRNRVTRRLKPCPRKASAWSGNQLC